MDQSGTPHFVCSFAVMTKRLESVRNPPTWRKGKTLHSRVEVFFQIAPALSGIVRYRSVTKNNCYF